MKPRINRLFADIETSPNVVLSWRVGYDINIDNDNILKERAIICIGYKWEHQKKAKVLRWDSNQCDKKLLKEFIEVANKADEIVFHNGDKFDMPWIRARAIFHGLDPMPQYRTIDTLKWARNKFLFNSNKLDYIAKYLGLGGKIKTEFGLWKKIVLDKDIKAMNQMCVYCAKDVELLQEVWQKMEYYLPHKTHAGVASGNDRWTCPVDGSENVVINKKRISASGNISYHMQCKDCGRYYSISKTAYNDYVEWRKTQ